jgi:hypothetical protein
MRFFHPLKNKMAGTNAVRRDFTFVAAFLISLLVAPSVVESKPKSALTSVRLEDLDHHLSRYADFTAFLSDEAGLIRYRELLKTYMHYDETFDEIFEATIRQMNTLNREIPDFGKKIWRNVAKDEKPIVIETSKSQRSGIETDRASLETALTDTTKKYLEEGDLILKLNEGAAQKKVFEELKAKILTSLSAIENKYSADVRKDSPSNAEMKRINMDPELRRQRQEYFEKIKKFRETNSELRIYLAALRYWLTQDERWLDVYRRNFGEDSFEALRSLDTFESSEFSVEDILSSDLMPDERLRRIAKGTDGLFATAQKDWKKLQEFKKKIAELVTPREAPELLQELQQIQAQNPGIAPAEIPDKLSESGKRLRQKIEKDREEIYYQKRSLVRDAHSNNLYRLPILDDRGHPRIELRQQTSKNITLIPMHSLHAAFSGRLTKECVGGGELTTLTPRRWALSALDDVRTYAAEKGEVFDGAVRLIAVHSSNARDKIYESVDMMITSISDTIEIRSKVTGQSAKYPLFDAILDRLVKREGSLGFVAGDGHAISQNTGLAKVYSHSPSVVAATRLENGTLLLPLDTDLSIKVNKLFRETPHGYNPGGMIFEGMAGDGKRRFLLRARGERRKFTIDDLELMLLTAKIEGNDIFVSQAWSLAIESDIKLKNPSHYQKLDNYDQTKILAWLLLTAKSADFNRRAMVYEFLTSVQAPRVSPAVLRSFATAETLSAAMNDISPPVRRTVRHFLSTNYAKRLNQNILVQAIGAGADGNYGADVYDWLASTVGSRLDGEIIRKFATVDRLARGIRDPELAASVLRFLSNSAKELDQSVVIDTLTKILRTGDEVSKGNIYRELTSSYQPIDSTLIRQVATHDVLKNALFNFDSAFLRIDVFRFLASSNAQHVDEKVIRELITLESLETNHQSAEFATAVFAFLASAQGRHVDKAVVKNFATAEKLTGLMTNKHNLPPSFQDTRLRESVIQFLYSSQGTLVEQKTAVELIQACSSHHDSRVRAAVFGFLNDPSSAVDPALVRAVATPATLEVAMNDLDRDVRSTVLHFLASSKSAPIEETTARFFWKLTFRNLIWDSREFDDFNSALGQLEISPLLWDELVDYLKETPRNGYRMARLIPAFSHYPDALWKRVPELLKYKELANPLALRILGAYWPNKFVDKIPELLESSCEEGRWSILLAIRNKDYFLGETSLLAIEKLLSSEHEITRKIAFNAVISQLHRSKKAVPSSLILPIVRMLEKKEIDANGHQYLSGLEWPIELWRKAPELIQRKLIYQVSDHPPEWKDLPELFSILPPRTREKILSNLRYKVENGSPVWRFAMILRENLLLPERKELDLIIKERLYLSERINLRCQIFMQKISAKIKKFVKKG